MNRAALFLLAATLLLGPKSAGAAESSAAERPSLGRIRADIEYLAGDALQGRGILTEGNRKAAAYIRRSFQEDGLVGPLPGGGYFQTFPINLGAELDAKKSRLQLTLPEESRTLSLGEDYQPLAAGSGGHVKGPVVFAGYGITAPKQGYDDYSGLDVSGDVVLILRKEPQQSNPEGAFDGTEVTRHAFIRTKLKRAEKAGAAAVLLVNDAATAAEADGDEKDRLARFAAFGRALAEIPFAQVTRQAVNCLLAEAPLQTETGTYTSLRQIEKQIDETFQPVAAPFEGVTGELHFAFDRKVVEVPNVIGVVPGERADEYVVVGAHLDHVGFGAVGSRTPGVHEVHNGADDNASGIAALLELARRTAAGPPPKRSVVFIAFNGEERGLLGSRYYLEHPVVPVDQTIAMVNFDMVGRWGDHPMTLFGIGTAEEFDELIGPIAARQGDDFQPVEAILRVSDHYPFYRREIPVFHFFTGLTRQYHTPADDIKTLHMGGIVRTVNIAETLLRELLTEKEGFDFSQVDIQRPMRKVKAYLGVVTDHSWEGNGVKVTGTSPESPAQECGLQAGDLIVQFGDVEIRRGDQLAKALRTYDAGETVSLTVLRDGSKATVSVTLSRRSKESRPEGTQQ